MGRSVMTASDTVFYMITPSFAGDPDLPLDPDGNEQCDYYDWDDFKEDLISILREAFPSLSAPSRPRWLYNECSIILENGNCSITLSEYCGLTAICLVPFDDQPLSTHWCDQVESTFMSTLSRAFPSKALTSMGRASNGEQFFRPTSRPDGLVTSKEGTLW